jgi:hypothetical protein
MQAMRAARPGRPAVKPFQAKPSKTKQNYLEWHEFIRPNQVFSASWREKNK